MKFKKFFIIFLAMMALAAGILSHRLTAETQTTVKKPGLPDITLPDLKGTQRKLSEWQDKVLVLNFWATWCSPCRKEIPEFIKLQTEFGPKGLQFIGIAVEESEPVKEYSDSVGINYPTLIGQVTGINLSIPLGNMISTVPFTVIFDQQGNIVHRQLGELSREKILEIVTPLLENN
jgi:thiol-disulfide isomerase/thioredoxin